MPPDSAPPLRPSPLKLIGEEFLEISICASDEEEPPKEIPLRFHREWGTAKDTPSHWRLILTIKFGRDGKDATRKTRYYGLVRIAGYFQVSENYPAEKASDLIRITGASMLYGACREMLANLTARMPHEMVTLMSISFVPEKSEQKQASQSLPAQSKISKAKLTDRRSKARLLQNTEQAVKKTNKSKK